ncbi:hypothetical protein STAS_26218 [Striga asiatica]|uniref:Uncharacterized protein n=1 Tax=Striga asiatica TaxID=4170 RepID=A0A5A7QYG4_STRAF|nr:hypothetical protein STAS_26218 [Striga asiatica]
MAYLHYEIHNKIEKLNVLLRNLKACAFSQLYLKKFAGKRMEIEQDEVFIPQTNVSYQNKRVAVTGTKERKCGETRCNCPARMIGESLQGRRGALMKITRELIDDASLTEARSKFLMEKLKVWKWEVGQIDDKECMSKQLKGLETFFVCDPEPIRTKGCGKRLKSICVDRGVMTRRKCPSHSNHLEDDPYRPDMKFVVPGKFNI